MTPAIEMTPPPGLEAFLEASGWSDCVISPVAGDASFRRYFRVRAHNGDKAILMDAPPPHEDPQPFIKIAEYLAEHGFRAPGIFARDLSRGLVLIEDFGDQRMREHLEDHPGDEAAIYKHAIDVIVDLGRQPQADTAPYNMAAYLREVRLLTEWYLPAMALPFDQSSFDYAWTEALAPVAQHQQVTVLRDYHAENIMLLDNGQQGLIDFQDALVGHPAYDLVSLLQDARRDVSPELERAMLEHYEQTAQPDEDFDLHYALLGAQRNTKIIGIFTRLWHRDGKERYLSFLPRMWGLLERDLAHPGLLPLKTWFDHNIPAEVRAQSPAQVSTHG